MNICERCHQRIIPYQGHEDLCTFCEKELATKNTQWLTCNDCGQGFEIKHCTCPKCASALPSPPIHALQIGHALIIRKAVIDGFVVHIVNIVDEAEIHVDWTHRIAQGISVHITSAINEALADYKDKGYGYKESEAPNAEAD